MMYTLSSGSCVIRDADGAFVPNDAANMDWLAYQAWLAAGNTPNPVPPQPRQVPPPISDRQFFQQLAILGRITQAEALAYVGGGTLPASMVTLINQLPSDQQFSAKMLVIGATSFQRNYPLVEALGQMYGMTDADLDALWIAAALL